MEAPNPVPAITQFIQAMPKAELHLHLEGAIQPQTMLTLARRHNQTLPVTSLEEMQRWLIFTDFQHFRQICRVMKDLLQTPEDFALVAYECSHDMAAQNIHYREVSVTAYAHTHYL